MTPQLAKQIIAEAGFDTLEDLLTPAVAIRPRVLYAAEPRRRRGRWLDWLLKPQSDQPAVETVPVLDDLALPIGASRFDSVPDVPFGFEWPCTPSGTMLECLAQIDLSELHEEDGATTLPASGWLLFFVGQDDSLGGDFVARALHLEPQPLTRWATHAPRLWTRQTCRLDFEAIYTLPDARDECVRQRIEFVGAHDEHYVALQERLSNGARHYLLGYPRAISGDVRAEAARSAGPARPVRDAVPPTGEEYALLLQLDSDPDGPGWMWGDAGSIYFLIRKRDLAARRFEKTQVIVQRC